MAIGTNDFDDYDFSDEIAQESPQIDDINDIESPDSSSSDDIIEEFLRSKGIEDSSKIKFENEYGEIEEVDWNSLDKQDQLNILNSSSEVEAPETGLDDSEIQLLNAIRSSNLTPAEYLQHLSRSSVAAYVQNVQSQNQVFNIDQYSDEELYVMDLLSKSGDVSQEEAIEALENAKSNETLFRKQMNAIRDTYRKEEQENIYQHRLMQEQALMNQYNYFSELIGDALMNFSTYSDGSVELAPEDMNNIYHFITGTDNAGNNWFNKALQDPNLVVRMAYSLLYGDQMIADINDYYQKRITEVRKESYNKGLADAGKGDIPTTVYKPKTNRDVNQAYDIDEEF